QIVLAYAVTVHKSQGSEYPVVVMPVTTQHFIMLQRNLLYTAVTRAKRMVVLVGTKKAIAIAVKNNKIEIRNSLLKDFLKGEAKQLAIQELNIS
ncbi:MAG: ATP-binding domain-containing protein, partial [Limnochordia bacterium]|nr:ATP-binding domain-containing protein [Limnochordia bacterium]